MLNVVKFLHQFYSYQMSEQTKREELQTNKPVKTEAAHMSLSSYSCWRSKLVRCYKKHPGVPAVGDAAWRTAETAAAATNQTATSRHRLCQQTGIKWNNDRVRTKVSPWRLIMFEWLSVCVCFINPPTLQPCWPTRLRLLSLPAFG